MSEPPLLLPDWPAPPSIGAFMTTRQGGVSAAPWDSLNLGGSVGDDPRAVRLNRERVAQRAGVPVLWPRQVHGTRVLRVDRSDPGQVLAEADAMWTDEPGVALAVPVADCLPVLFCLADGSAVAAAHAGWRGLAAGVLEQTVQALCDAKRCAGRDLLAWIGPGIGAPHYEVGEDVRQAFAERPGDLAALRPHPRADGSTRWRADLAAIARGRLAALGLNGVFGGRWCTFADAARWFSHRRDGRSGRMAGLIWIRG